MPGNLKRYFGFANASYLALTTRCANWTGSLCKYSSIDNRCVKSPLFRGFRGHFIRCTFSQLTFLIITRSTPAGRLFGCFYIPVFTPFGLATGMVGGAVPPELSEYEFIVIGCSCGSLCAGKFVTGTTAPACEFGGVAPIGGASGKGATNDPPGNFWFCGALSLSSSPCFFAMIDLQ